MAPRLARRPRGGFLACWGYRDYPLPIPALVRSIFGLAARPRFRAPAFLASRFASRGGRAKAGRPLRRGGRAKAGHGFDLGICYGIG